jgi:nitrate/nitrite-specific signal transduction histidine kinase
MEDKPHADFPYGKSTLIYVVALSFLGIAVLAGFLLVRELHERTAHDARIVNAAGRQRMLAQHVARSALVLGGATSPAEREKSSRELRETFDEWRQGHERIVRADAGRREGLLRVPSNQKRFSTLEDKFLRVETSVERVLGQPSPTVHELGGGCDAYVAEMDSLLGAMERDSESRAMSVTRTLQAIVGLALVLIAVEGLFVFRPLLLGLRSSYGRLRDAHEQVQRELAARIEAERERDVLKGLLPICAGCKKIRDDEGSWRPLELYIEERSEARFTHGLCQDCIRRLYPDHADAILAKIDRDGATGDGAG